MKAQALISGATYGPDALKVICKAFDDAGRLPADVRAAEQPGKANRRRCADCGDSSGLAPLEMSR